MNNKIKIVLFAFILSIIFIPKFSKAEGFCVCVNKETKEKIEFYNVSESQCLKYNEDDRQTCSWSLFDSKMMDQINNLNQLKVNTPQSFVGLLIKTVMEFLGTITLLMIIYGGVIWMTSNGNSDKTDKAKNIIVWASLGVVVIFAAYAILNTVFKIFE
ncbi:MAG: hypothetical protein WC414_03845 [Patescibacteria group bacterium]